MPRWERPVERHLCSMDALRNRQDVRPLSKILQYRHLSTAVYILRRLPFEDEKSNYDLIAV